MIHHSFEFDRLVQSPIRTHSEAEFTHSMCPDCAEKTYAEMRQLKKDLGAAR